MISVQRIFELEKIDQEKRDGKRNIYRHDWPSNGSLCIKNLSLKYSNNLPEVLHGISMDIKSGEKIGIVGRTGAGKTSILASLFRLAEPSGEIILDGVNLLECSLDVTRSKIACIPQDPVLFSGTVRTNLDPFGDYTDNEIFSTLSKVQLKEKIESSIEQLNYPILQAGSNLSIGEKQLICLARALLRNTKIILLDEATSHVDYKTENSIKHVIQNHLKNHTIITIAHRLSTITNYDKIFFLKDGRIIEEWNYKSVKEKF